MAVIFLMSWCILSTLLFLAILCSCFERIILTRAPGVAKFLSSLYYILSYVSLIIGIIAACSFVINIMTGIMTGIIPEQDHSKLLSGTPLVLFYILLPTMLSCVFFDVLSKRIEEKCKIEERKKEVENRMMFVDPEDFEAN